MPLPFIDLVIVLGSATLVATFFHAIRFPILVAFLATGILIGPHGFKLVSATFGAKTMTEVGAVLLFFTLGLEFSFRRLLQLRRPFIGLGLSQVFLTIGAVMALSYFLFGASWEKAAIIGFVISLSSTATVLKLLQDSRDTGTVYSDATIGVLLFQDLAVIPMILALPLLAGKTTAAGITVNSMLSWVGITFAIAAGVWFGSKYAIPALLKRVVHTRSRELFFFCILFICICIAFLFESIGLSLSLGAFLAGVIISESPYGKQATSDLSPLRDNFLSLFFIAIGMQLDLKFFAGNWKIIVGLLVLLIGFKAGLIYGIARFNRYNHRIALYIGLILFQIGEFSILLVDSAQRLGVFTPIEVQFILSIVILSLSLTPFTFRIAPHLTFSDFYQDLIPNRIRKTPQIPSIPKRTDGRHPTKDYHTIIVGFGAAGQNLAAALKTLDIPYKVIDTNPNTIETFTKKGEPILFGDASHREILEHAGIDTARLVVVTVTGAKVISGIVSGIKRVRPDLHILIRLEYLREATKYAKSQNVELVVGEFETGIEVLARTLSLYGVGSKEVHNFILESRKRLAKSLGAFTSQLKRSIELPTWEALSAIHPISIRENDFADGKSISQIDLRAHTGATIVIIYRQDVGSKIPTSDFVLEQGDVIYIIGNEENILAAEDHFAEGPRIT